MSKELKWEFYGKDKIIIGTTIFTLEELQNATYKKFKRDAEQIKNLNAEIAYIKDYLKSDLMHYDRHEEREWGRYNNYMQAFYLLKSIRDFERKQRGE